MTNHTNTRICSLEAGLSSKQKDKIKIVRHQVEIALARTYGNRLSPIIVENLLSQVILNSSVLAHLEEVAVDEIPTNSKGWDSLAKELAEQDELACRNLDFSNSSLKAELRAQAVAAVQPSKRIAMARAGTLDTYLDECVIGELERRGRQ
ncbi:hypothetical protein [Pseudohalocynthiibacter sp. F2068]|uniref:hypothetical protein n=1 Tax=Pseudohalocynthiibacter sp. F2068 TaxID=2926418 RepID=UPI001FF35ADD|nr:hypothetical protein [Pseudohalocynthiibacter sp. F2068]MCK0104393.1 hypothetical protein [Pseudohalocynthiibacter sp. F2068]